MYKREERNELARWGQNVNHKRYDELNALNLQPFVKVSAGFLGIADKGKSATPILIKDATLTVIRLR